MMERVYTILELDQHYVENFKIYKDFEKAKKHLNKYLLDSGVGIVNRRKHLKAEFYKEGDKQIQLIKTEMI
jgi:hypothetical protein